MENIGDECNWENIFIQNEETNTFFPNEELDSWGFDEAVSSYYDSSSPDGPPSSSLSPSKNIVSERNRRRKLNERLFALRAVVPNISKMDKASIIKDAIEYIQELHEQERRVQTEISEIETGKMMMKNDAFDSDMGVMGLARLKKKRIGQCYDTGTRASPVEVLELNVSTMGERILVVSLTCSKRTDTMVKLCEAFESLKLKIITANITALSGRLLKTVFIEANEEEKELLRKQIINAITALNEPESPMSI